MTEQEIAQELAEIRRLLTNVEKLLREIALGLGVKT